MLPNVTIRPQRLASALTNALNPFVIFTALFALVAFVEAGVYRGLLYLAVELTAAAVVAGYVLYAAALPRRGLLDLRPRRTSRARRVSARGLRGTSRDPGTARCPRISLC